MKRVKWLILGTTVLLAVIALVEINYVSGQMRRAEVEKVKLWVNAIAQKARLVNYSQQFFASVARDERRKMDLYTNILCSFDRVGEGADADFCLDYVRYIVDSCETALIITNDDSVITVPSELAGERLEGARLKEFSHNKPFHYRIWGMGMTLYYKESRMYTDLRRVLDGFNRSFLEEITNNGVLVPVLVVDSLKTKVLASGNMKKEEFATPACPTGNRPLSITRTHRCSRHCGGFPFYISLFSPFCLPCRTTSTAPPATWSRTVSGWAWPKRRLTSWERPSHR